MRRFELVEGTSAKFWQVSSEGNHVTTQWGRLGTDGQSKTKTLADPGKAADEMRKLIDQKTKKGYVEVGVAVAASSAPAAGPAPAPEPETAPAPEPAAGLEPAAAPETAAELAPEPKAVPSPAPAPSAAAPTPSAAAAAPSGVAPWLRDGDPIDLDDQFVRWTAPARSHPQPVPDLRDELARSIRVFRLGESFVADAAATSPEALDLLQAALAADDLETLTPAQAIGILVMEPASGGTGGAYALPRIAVRFGVVETTRFLLESYRYKPRVRWGSGKQPNVVSFAVDSAPYRGESRQPMGDAELALRRLLAAADDADYEAAVQVVRDAWPSLTPFRQAGLALMLPDRPELSDELILAHAQDRPNWMHWLQATAGTQELASIAATARSGDYLEFGSTRVLVDALVLEQGIAATARLAPSAAFEETGEALTRIGTPDAVRALVAVAHTSKDAGSRLNRSVQRWPVAATAGLAEAATAAGRAGSTARSVLSSLVAEEPGRVELVRNWLSPAARAVLDELAGRLSGTLEEAPDEALPAVLVSPPWLRKRAEIVPLDLAPLSVAPVERWREGARESLLAAHRSYRRAAARSLDDLDAVVAELCTPRYGFSRADQSLHDPYRRAMAAALQAGDVPAAARVFGEWALEHSRRNRYGGESVDGHLLAEAAVPVLDRIRPGLALELWNAIAGTVEADEDVDYVMARYGLSALEGFRRVLQRRPTEQVQLALAFGAVDLAPIMARGHHKLKTVREESFEWIARFPEHAAAGLIAPALGKPGEARDCARAALQRLCSPDRADDARETVLEVAGRYGREDVLEAVRLMLDEEATERVPTRIQPLPSWWAPAAWRRVELADGKALPLRAVDRLGTMLTFPIVDDEVYPGIRQVVDAVDGTSLAEFGWDMFNAWLAAGGPTKDAWAMTSLGIIGSDETARRITPYLRSWPGESQHKRAVTGLSVLAGIGTDLALMQLNGIATKVKFKALQTAARERIDQIARTRGLTTEELEDRLAPDLGLAEDGTMTLDFGPRAFTVGFDETLKPYVRDADGARLKELPKPRQSDDAELAAAATTAWKALKKDARAVASQQVQRLELAMCAQRRWPLETFERFLARHPLVRHLVQRLVWAAYDAENRPTRFFRVAEDGERTDGEDEPIELAPDAVVGLPHPLEIPEAEAAAFGQLFTDYELVQPFDQLARESHALSGDEAASTELTRWADRTVPVGRVLGLANRGWQRGVPADGGVAGYMEKPLGGGRSIVARLDPGLFTGYLDEAPEQTVTAVQVGSPGWWGDVADPVPFGDLSPIVVSEMIRDLEGLRD